MSEWWNQLNDLQRAGVIFGVGVLIVLLGWWAFKTGKDGDYL